MLLIGRTPAAIKRLCNHSGEGAIFTFSIRVPIYRGQACCSEIFTRIFCAVLGVISTPVS